MACTTLLVGKGATYDGSTMVARNEDDGDGSFCAKKMVVVNPADQPRTYRCVISHLTIDLPENPLRYTAVPNVDPSEGVWAEAGVNSANVGMSATETITTNSRVLGADPLVAYRPATGVEGQPGYVPEQAGGIGEEDLVTICLPYITSARQGVERLGALHERYGTYESNGIAVSDASEIWYFETVGGHHWIARRVPDDAYVTQPNQLGIDRLDLIDALGDGENYRCSADLVDFIVDNNLYLGMPKESVAKTVLGAAAAAVGMAGASSDERLRGLPRVIDPRPVFGSHDYADHVYNTPRAWYMQRCLNPSDSYDGPDATYTPESDDLPWCRVPERKVTVEDVKRVLSSHYQDTVYDPYGTLGTKEQGKLYRPIGINRNNETSLIQIRPSVTASHRAVQWVAMGDMTYATFIPMFANVSQVPAYLDVAPRVTTETFYWEMRVLAALADAQFGSNWNTVAAYQEDTLGQGHAQIKAADAAVDAMGDDADEKDVQAALERANQATCDLIQKATDDVLGKVLFTTSVNMRDRFNMNDR